MNTNKKITEDEIILAPPTELFEEAKQIAKSTSGDDEFLFTIQYDVNEKELLLSVMEMAGVNTEDVEVNIVTAWMNMTQLKLIRSLNCVERVMTDERRNKFIVREASMENLENESTFESVDTISPSSVTALSAARTMALNLDEAAGVVTMNDDVNLQGNDGVALAANYVSATNCCCPPTNTTMETAKTIRVESTVNGNICCPGAEQWFKFTAAKTGRHTIYTSGSLDTIGTLYDSCGNQIVEADVHEPTGSLNFRIVQNLTKDATYYLKVRVWGSGTGNYTLQVTERVFADYVSINKDTIVLEKNVVYELPLTPNYTYKGYNDAKPIPGLSVSLSPTYADNQEIFWYVYGNNNLTCKTAWDDDGDRYWHLIASDDGIATLYADDWAGNGKRGQCKVYVGGHPITGIIMDCTRKIISLGDSEQLTANVFPANAWNKDIIWISSDNNIATIDKTGKVTAYKVGTTRITARAHEGDFFATCDITVDPRPHITIEEDDEGGYDFFKATFPASEGGLIWKSVGMDLEGTNPLIYQSHWNRYYFNQGQNFDERQLAFLYLLDPLGVTYYMKYNIYSRFEGSLSDKTYQTCMFKDRVYTQIFGTYPRLIKIFPGDTPPAYFVYDPLVSQATRLDYYTDAEVLFGVHKIYDWLTLADFVVNYGIPIVKSLFTTIWPVLGTVLSAVELCKVVFFGGAVNDTLSSGASSSLEEYMTNFIRNDDYQESFSKMFRWLSFAFGTIVSILESDSVLTPSVSDIIIYDKVNTSNYYRVTLKSGDKCLSMQELVEFFES